MLQQDPRRTSKPEILNHTGVRGLGLPIKCSSVSQTVSGKKKRRRMDPALMGLSVSPGPEAITIGSKFRPDYLAGLGMQVNHRAKTGNWPHHSAARSLDLLHTASRGSGCKVEARVFRLFSKGVYHVVCVCVCVCSHRRDLLDLTCNQRWKLSLKPLKLSLDHRGALLHRASKAPKARYHIGI